MQELARFYADEQREVHQRHRLCEFTRGHGLHREARYLCCYGYSETVHVHVQDKRAVAGASLGQARAKERKREKNGIQRGLMSIPTFPVLELRLWRLSERLSGASSRFACSCSGQ